MHFDHCEVNMFLLYGAMFVVWPDASSYIDYNLEPYPNSIFYNICSQPFAFLTYQVQTYCMMWKVKKAEQCLSSDLSAKNYIILRLAELW